MSNITKELDVLTDFECDLKLSLDQLIEDVKTADENLKEFLALDIVDTKVRMELIQSIKKKIRALEVLKNNVKIKLDKYPRRNEVHICKDGYPSIGFTVNDEDYAVIREISDLHIEF